MKKLILMLLVILLIFSVNSMVFAEDGESTVTPDQSVETPSQSVENPTPTPVPNPMPKLMIEKYDIGNKYLIPGEAATLTITFKNTSSSQTIKNVKLSFFEDSGQILPKEIGTQFVKNIAKSKQYEWQLDIFAIETAESKPYAITITMEYEDSNADSITMTDKINLFVRQPARLEYGKIELPQRLTQTDSVPFSVALMNLGKSNILNALLTFEIPGLNNGSSILVGTIEPGESKNGAANFRVEKDVLGEVSGKLIISYEDEYGETYKKEIPLNTVIEEKIEIKPETPVQAEAKEENKSWIIYIAVGIIIAAILIIFIIKYIKQRNQIKVDEMRF